MAWSVVFPAPPSNSRFYITNEAESTLDVADANTLKVTKRNITAVLP